MKKLLILTYSIIFYNLSVIAQPSILELAKNEMKYWKLRGRITGDHNNKDVYNGFMTIGLGSGKSIPAYKRLPLYSQNWWFFDPTLQNLNGLPTGECSNQGIHGQNTIDSRDNNLLKGINDWEDNPLVSLGNYLGVLATEWDLLQKNGSSTWQTETEIYYALKALERLDYYAESANYSEPNSTNGFLMRDDVPQNFELNNTGKNIDMVSSRFSCTAYDKNNPTLDEVIAVGCDGIADNPGGPPYIIDYVSRNTIRKNVMSQDEVVGILLGLSLVKKCIPTWLSVNGTNLRNLNSDIAERIINYVKKGGTTNYWVIVDPKDNLPVCRGPFAMFFSYPLAQIGKIICNKNFHNGHSLHLGYPVWKILKQVYSTNSPQGITLAFQFVPQIQQALNITSNYAYIVAPKEHPSAYNISMFLKLVTCSKTGARPNAPYYDFKGKTLVNTISQTYEKQLYDLVGSYIYPYNPVTTCNWWAWEFGELNCSCNCIHNYNPNNGPPPVACSYFINTAYNPASPIGKWNTANRWGNRYYDNDMNSYPNQLLNEYSGLDYMLAYNLYKLNYYNSGYVSKIRKNVANAIFPWTFPLAPYPSIGSSQYPSEVKAVFSIKTDNTVLNSNAVVHYFAGSDIKFGPGFHAKQGAVFTAKIQDYDCTPQQFFIGNTQMVSFKTEDTLTQNTYLDFLDTVTTSIVEDSNDVEVPPDYDSNILIVRYSNDTIFFDVNPDYVVDDSGNYTYAPTNNKAALDEATINNITLFPNPSSTSAIVEYMLYYDSEVKITVNDELGREMRNVIPNEILRQQKGKQKILLNTAGLSTGVYFCTVELNGRREVLKFSVLR